MIPIQTRDFVWEELLEGYNNAPHSTFSGFKRALKWLGEGRINVEGLITTVSPKNPEEVYNQIQNKDIKEPFIIYDWENFL